MKIYKFGGASVKDAAGVQNLAKIVKTVSEPLVVVVSAMGKTTNAMEDIVASFFNRDTDKLEEQFMNIKAYHVDIINELGIEDKDIAELYELFNALWTRLKQEPSLNYDFEYDQIVPFGELFSTRIVNAFLQSEGVISKWLDARQIIKTDDLYRDAGIDWELSEILIAEVIDVTSEVVNITQGFIGSTINNISTTLGREGSDYTAAIIAHLLNAGSVTIWKDVPGVLNADPRWYPETVQIDEMSYLEAIELSYFGAQVIHPKTLKPLQNKGIPLYVKSFVNPEGKGTVIHEPETEINYMPVYILKQKQVFITMSPRDFSFIVEENLSEIFKIFSELHVKINLMQNSALNFSVSIDYSEQKLNKLLEALKQDFVVRYNSDIELLSVRHYTQDCIDSIIKGKEILDSQTSRKTARFVLKSSAWEF